MARDGHPWTLVTLATKVVHAARGGQVSSTSGHLALPQAQRRSEESARCPDAWVWLAARFCSQKLELDGLMNPKTSLKQNKFCSFSLESQWIETRSRGKRSVPGNPLCRELPWRVPSKSLSLPAVTPTSSLQLPGDSGRERVSPRDNVPPSLISAPGNAVRKQRLTRPRSLCKQLSGKARRRAASGKHLQTALRAQEAAAALSVTGHSGCGQFPASRG